MNCGRLAQGQAGCGFVDSCNRQRAEAGFVSSLKQLLLCQLPGESHGIGRVSNPEDVIPVKIGRFCNQPAVRLRCLQWLWLPRCRNQALRCLSTRNDEETPDCWATRAAPWSAAARGRFGWARRVAPKESGDTSPHFKMSNLQIPANAEIEIVAAVKGGTGFRLALRLAGMTGSGDDRKTQ